MVRVRSSIMEFGATNLAVPHKLSLLNALESLADLRDRGRNRFLPSRDVIEEELVCPKPHRAGAGMSSTPLDASAKPFRRLRGTTSLPVIGDVGHEILDILYSKVNCGDNGGPGSPNKYFSGSPPCRASNPMIYDAHFTQKRTMPSSIAIPQNTVCGASSLGGSSSTKSNSPLKSTCCSSPYGSKPFIRIEGFASATPDSNRGVPAYA
ncbi:hypothetical protein L7F22_008761 [Adiantum nelumboides]|nr:hypothetical protein [Adiantum nelumboides]